MRGLKYGGSLLGGGVVKSHPTMGAWIEITDDIVKICEILSRTPRWVRGLKYENADLCRRVAKVAPHDGCVD